MNSKLKDAKNLLKHTGTTSVRFAFLDCSNYTITSNIKKINNNSKIENKMKNLKFGEAVEQAKKGKLIARKGWNGKGMFVFIRPADELSVDMIINKVKSLPQAVKDYYKTYHWLDDKTNKPLTDEEAKVKFGEYFCMKDANNNIVNGWLASQTDMLANDWETVKY